MNTNFSTEKTEARRQWGEKYLKNFKFYIQLKSIYRKMPFRNKGEKNKGILSGGKKKENSSPEDVH